MEVLDIFYNEVIPEAAKGKIDSYFSLNILFNTYLVETNTKVSDEVNYDDVLVPTLMIKSKKVFDILLRKYINIAMEYYKDDKYLKEAKLENKEIKLLLSLLWSNATVEDYNNPNIFLVNRIAFLGQSLVDTKIDFGYIPLLDGNLSLEIQRDLILNETPSKMVFSLCDKENNNYYFPEVKFGLHNNEVYFYAIQNKEQEVNSYTKKVNRILYKVGDGFDSLTDNYDLYEEGNLKDITASFLVVINMAIAYLNSLGYSNIKVSSILPTRWNAKRMSIEEVAKRIKIFDGEKSFEEQNRIQNNLTQKFIRTFLRLAHHYEGMDVISYPYENDSYLHISLNDSLQCNNQLLKESFEIINPNKKSHKL